MSSTLSTTNISSKKKRKKIVIRSYKEPPKVPADFYETQSKLVLDATFSVLPPAQRENASLPQAHSRVLDLVQLKMGPRLYKDLVKSIQEAAASLVPVETTSSPNLLETIVQQYTQFLDYLTVVRHVCLSLDRQYVWNLDDGKAILRTNSANAGTSASSSLSLWQVGLHVFSERLKQLGLDEECYNAWWNELWLNSWKHPSSTENLKLLSQVVKVWHELGWKATLLKTKLQPQLVQHLQQESQEYSTSTPQDFVQRVYEKWMLVSQHWSAFLPRVWVRSLVEVYLLQPNLPSLYEKLSIDDQEHIHRLFLLTARLQDEHSLLTSSITRYSQDRGKRILESQNYSPKSIQGLLELQSTLQNLQSTLSTTLPIKTVFGVVMQEPQTAEALAKYMDSSFKSSKSTPPLEQLLELFCHVSAKDVFEAFYKRDLGKRLLSGRVQNLDTERHFLSLLKSECGAGYTSKMEGMFQDCEWSREQMSRYQKMENACVDIDVQVLTTGYWPVSPSYTLDLPEKLLEVQEHFEEYYKKTFQGRRIAWQHALGHVTVKARFAKKTYDIVMSLACAVVLLCFNDTEKWTLPQLAERVGLEDRSEMERILMTLALGKVKLLQKCDYDAKPGTKPRPNVHDDDVFTVNAGFFSPLKKIKITNISKPDANKEERAKTMEMISRDRLYLLDAVLVRIMKARKTMLHSELIPLVMEHAKVPVTPTDVKGRIESLMDREYLERDKEDRNRYNYLA